MTHYGCGVGFLKGYRHSFGPVAACAVSRDVTFEIDPAGQAYKLTSTVLCTDEVVAHACFFEFAVSVHR